ncbi:MAG: MBOAT family protein [Bacteroidia bacterium]|nr:MBOAT family protein [Bacteroidia bacterium]
MVFSSAIFLFIFLPWTLMIHYFLDPRYRNFFLLLVSLVFYAWGEGLLTILIVTSIFVNYLGGLLISHYKSSNEKRARIALGSFIALNIIVLIYFKYFNFIVYNLQVAGLFTNYAAQPIHLPIGISFYTFHIISYLIDVYRRDATSQKNPFDLGLYIFLFPQLVAGPIIRYKDISQKIASRFIIGEDFTKGATRFIRGLAKKMLIANNVAIVADNVFALDPAQIPASAAWLAIICYTLQIYFDFSGYSDMALGLGKMMGFNFPENFNYPYIADSIREFWQRWHISLSTWFRDYLYIPLGGNKKGKFATYRNMFIVFFITGLWHGASWNFIVWGLFHGCFLVMERAFLGKWLQKIPAFFRHVYMLLVVVVAWVFFRAETLTYAIGYLKSMVGLHPSENYIAFSYLDNYSLFILPLAIILTTNIRSSLEKLISTRFLAFNRIAKNGFEVASYLTYILVLIFCAVELSQNNYNPFIYFRF